YSNTGFVILGRVVEKVAGEPFKSFLERRILKPLDMKHTYFEPRGQDQDLAQGTASFAFAPPQAARLEAPGWIFTAGALYSSAPDLTKWDLALMEGRVLKPDSYHLMTTPATLVNGKQTGYGCGLALSQRRGQRIF